MAERRGQRLDFHIKLQHTAPEEGQGRAKGRNQAGTGGNGSVGCVCVCLCGVGVCGMHSWRVKAHVWWELLCECVLFGCVCGGSGGGRRRRQSEG